MSTGNDAQDYALLIRQELDALEILLTNWGDIAGIEEHDANLDEATLDEVKDALLALEMEWPDDDGADVVGMYLDQTCLDVDVWRKVSSNDNSTKIEILRTCGGPRCDIFRDSEDGSAIEVRVSSGSDSHILRRSFPALSEMLDFLGEAY